MPLKNFAPLLTLLFSCLLHVSVSATIFKPSHDGSFIAELDLELAPLEKQVFQPQYNSFKGNGLLGVGWSMLATSSISRCSTTQPHLSSSLRTSHLDAFCLDGEILEPIHPGTLYQVTLLSGERQQVQKFGDCKDRCYFIVTNGTGAGVTGEIRWYGLHDTNPANGKSSFPGSHPLVWPLSIIRVGDDQINFDHKTNFITETSLPYSAISTRIDPETNIQTATDIRFIYQTRKDDFVGSVDGHDIKLANLLTEIQFIPRTHGTENDASVHKRNVIQFKYELGEDVHEKLLTKVEHCEWKESDENKWQVCQSNRLLWTYVFPDKELDCERHWNIPYENYLVCDQQRYNYVALALIDNGSLYNQLYIQYQLNPADATNSLASSHIPLLSLSSISSFPRSTHTMMNQQEILFPFRTEVPSDTRGNRWTFEWSEPRELKYGRATGFNTRKATSFQLEEPTKLITHWENQGDFGHMIKQTNYRKGPLNGTFSCEYALQGSFQPYISKRFEDYSWSTFGNCLVERSFTIDPTNFESVLAESNSIGNWFCNTFNIKVFNNNNINNMSAYNGYLEKNSCDPVYSLLDLNLSGPQANSTQILFPPDVKSKKGKTMSTPKQGN